MAITEEARAQLAFRCGVLLGHLNERQRRLMLATEARLLGHGGVRAVAGIAGVSETTVRRGVAELDAGAGGLPAGRVRAPGGGRKRVEEDDPQVIAALLALVEPDERGDPQSPLRWTTKSLRHLAEELTGQGHRASAPTVGRLLQREGFSLQANAKTLEGAQHPTGTPSSGISTGRSRSIRPSASRWSAWTPRSANSWGGCPWLGGSGGPRVSRSRSETTTCFFTGPGVEQAIPYGIYDPARNTGWVNVGVDHDTAVFAVESIRRWWRARGRRDYPPASRLLITADAGGSNGYRYRVWKGELATLAAETGLQITVCHFPPGTSKWNTIEHRLFAHITMNWRGRPLTSHEVVVKTIAATRTRSGLRVEAALDPGEDPTGVAISKQQLDALPIQPHAVHGAWNSTLHPQPASGALQAAVVACRAVPPSAARPCSVGWPIRG